MSSVTYELVVREVPSTCESQENTEVEVKVIRTCNVPLLFENYFSQITVYEEKVKFAEKEEAVKRARLYAESIKRAQTPLLVEKL